MKKIWLFFFACVMVAAFCSCEQKGVVENPPEPAVVEETEGVEDSTTTVQPSPIKGLWEYKITGMVMTFNFGEKDVEYRCHTDLMNATAIYKGTYSIKDNDITLEFTSLTSKPSNVKFTSPEDLPKEAVRKDEKTIVYIDNSYIRKE